MRTLIISIVTTCFAIAFTTTKGFSDELEEQLVACKDMFYKKLVKQDRIGNALSLKFSNKFPAECIGLAIASGNKKIFSNNDYHKTGQDDRDFRKTSESELADLYLKLKTDDQNKRYESSADIELFDYKTTQTDRSTERSIESVKGFGVISGSK